MKATMEISFNAVIENENFARSVIAAFITRLDPTIDEMLEVKTIVSEAVSNAIIHGYISILPLSVSKTDLDVFKKLNS